MPFELRRKPGSAGPNRRNIPVAGPTPDLALRLLQKHLFANRKPAIATTPAPPPTVAQLLSHSITALATAAPASFVFDAEPPAAVAAFCLVSSFGGKSYTFNVAYGVGKAAIDRLSVDMSYQLAKYGVATTTLYPGLVKTEANLRMEEDGTWDEQSGGLDLSLGESPAFSGKAVVELAALPKEAMMERSGNVEVVAELANEFDFNDVNGNRPPSIRSLKYLLPNFVFPSIEKELEDDLYKN